MKSNIIHIFIRLIFLIIPLWFLPEILEVFLGKRVENTPRCGMGDIVFPYLSIICVFIFWAIGLSIEAFYLDKKGKVEKGSINLIMSSIVFSFFFFLFLMWMMIKY